MGCCCTLLKTSSKTVNLFKITKYVNGTQHSGDHGNSDLERKHPTGTRQFGRIKASLSLAQAEIVEAVKLQVFREVCQAKLHWNIFFYFREISSTGLVNRVKIRIVLCLLRC